jgi:hypothetical protein
MWPGRGRGEVGGRGLGAAENTEEWVAARPGRGREGRRRGPETQSSNGEGMSTRSMAAPIPIRLGTNPA